MFNFNVTLLNLIFISLLGICSADIRIADETLNAEYSRLETIRLKVENREKDSLKIYSNAEVLDNEEWIAWPYRIEDGLPEGISTIRKLKAGGSILLPFSFANIEPPPIPKGEHPSCERKPSFRFRVVVIDRKGRKSEFFSKPFIVVDPYGICAESGFVR